MQSTAHLVKTQGSRDKNKQTVPESVSINLMDTSDKQITENVLEGGDTDRHSLEQMTEEM